MTRRSRRQRPTSLASTLLFLCVSVSSYQCAAADEPLSSPPAPALETTHIPVDDAKCDCFVTNGSDTAYFAHHAFYDFRSLAQYESVPSLLSDAGSATNAPATSGYFTSSTFTSFWQSQNWNNSAANASVLRINSLNNIYIEKDADNSSSSTWLTLRTARHAAFQSAAEIVTQNDTFQYLSMRMLARTIGDPGGCMGMFTYRDGSPSPGASAGKAAPGKDVVLQEVDLEVLTKYPRDHVQCTNQPSLDDKGEIIEAATQNVTLPDGLGWDDWAVYRLDWTPRQSTWYVNGQQIANISFQTPRDPTSIHLNAWSDGSKWTGTMAPGTQAHLQIQWWEVLYNATATNAPAVKDTSSGGGSCSAVCSIDDGNAPGQAVLVWGTASSGGDSGGGSNGTKNGAPDRLMPSWGGSPVFWMPLLSALFVLYPVVSR
ncbi:uncharacterized protein SPSK_07584 [Sporothrix schenckii 1099-18]|uniref:GH16 domain-containing protein n=1 Tax=Sporothrix schenckii 1099-18 TaxID=1397361 RepID=A0A0F2MI74_SPOSC|nr:uncharacterized protein SPSK_07584 [Sporothrix schenckii 1099-18]KJR87881.1 hypothetical protein SPSK_07584 [Sporothrix schenckii 1099-18]